MSDTIDSLSAPEALVLDRRRRGEDQRAAAARFGVSRTVYSRWERGVLDGPRPRLRAKSLTAPEICLVHRRRAGYKQDQVALALGVSRAWINRMERGLEGCERLLQYWENRTSV